MKKLVYNVGIVCLLALVCNCSNDELPTEDFKYVVTFGESYDTLSWSDMVDSVQYIPLKTPDGAMMGDIKQLVVAFNHMYAITQNGVYCFDMDGNTVFKVNQGRAHYEYLNANSISVSDRLLYLFDNYKQRILALDAINGEYCGEGKVPVGGITAYCLAGRFLFENYEIDSLGRYRLLKDNNLQHFEKGFIKGKEHGEGKWTNDGLLYSSHIRNLAWKLDGIDCIPYLKVVVPSDKALPDDIVSDLVESGQLPQNDKRDVIYYLRYLNECSGFITGMLLSDNIYDYFIHDKKTGNSWIFNPYSLKGLKFWEKLPLSEVSAGYDNCVYTVIDPMYAKFGDDGSKPSDPRLLDAYNVIHSSQKDDNPIIGRFWLKSIQDK
jgi:hypothetical protein